MAYWAVNFSPSMIFTSAEKLADVTTERCLLVLASRSGTSFLVNFCIDHPVAESYTLLYRRNEPSFR